MVSPVAQLTARLAYGATQLSRVAWYVGHGEIMRRLSRRARERDGDLGTYALRGAGNECRSSCHLLFLVPIS